MRGSKVPAWYWWLIIPGVLVGAFLVAFTVDRLVAQDEVPRNTNLAGQDIGGLGRDDVAEVVDALATDFAGSAVEIHTPDDVLRLDAAVMGVSVDAAATLDAAMSAGDGLAWPLGPLRWLGSFGNSRTVGLRFVVNTATAESALQGINTVVEPPVEPHVELAADGARLVGAKDGVGIDTSVILAALAEAVARGTDPIVIDIDYEALPPTTDESDYADLFAQVDRVRTTPADVTLNDYVGRIEPAEITKWMSIADSGTGPALALDAAQAQVALEAVLAPAKSGSGRPKFAVENGTVQLLDSEGGTVCCSPEAGAALTTALLGATPQPIGVPGRPRTPEEGLAEAQALGIVEEVASFTTNHSCCQSRVTNIHLFADMVRGDVILPGESYSLNEAVGERTTEKGFVEGGFIQNGVLTEAIGGGVSQFATTFFNAAFFAGLDYDEYQAHSIYFSRYPYGREATISWRQPDLVVRNTTPYGILVWPSYTDTSITVSLYSTKYVDVEQSGQSEREVGVCTRVTTERTRSYLDGRVVVDEVGASYRPEGLNCDGSPSDPSLTTTTAPPPTQPPPPATEPPTTQAPPPDTTPPSTPTT